MSDAPPILGYAAAGAVQRKLRLESDAESVRLIFLLLPNWAHLSQFALYSFLAVSYGAAGILQATEKVRFAANFPLPFNSTDIWAQAEIDILGAILAFAFWFVLALGSLHRYRHFRHIARVLELTPTELTDTRPGWWRIRKKVWPRSRVTGIKMETIPDIFRRWPEYRLVISFNSGLNRRIRMPRRDPDLRVRVTCEFQRILAIPV